MAFEDDKTVFCGIVPETITCFSTRGHWISSKWPAIRGKKSRHELHIISSRKSMIPILSQINPSTFYLRWRIKHNSSVLPGFEVCQILNCNQLLWLQRGRTSSKSVKDYSLSKHLWCGSQERGDTPASVTKWHLPAYLYKRHYTLHLSENQTLIE